MTWAISWRDRRWSEDDVLAADLVTVQMILDGDWSDCTPTAGPAQLVAFVAALESRSTGRDLQEVTDEVRMSPASEFAFEEVADGVH